MKPAGATRLAVIPCDLEDANAFVRQHHRHLGEVPGHKFSVAVADPDCQVRGVAIVGRPTGRHDQDGFTLQILRCATDGHPNAASALNGAVVRAAFALGYRRVVEFTFRSESGASLRAAGFQLVGERPARSWDCPSRPRVNKAPNQTRLRWEASA